MFHALQNIADTGAVQVGSDKEKEHAARVIKSDESVGYWFAESVSHELAGQFKGWLTYIAKAYSMTPKARAAAVSRLASIIKEMREHGKGLPDGLDKERAIKAVASATVMLSNFRTVLRALNAGLELELRRDEMGYLLHDREGRVVPVQPMTAIIADARLYLASHAANGEEKETRGRPATPWLDCLKATVKRRDDNEKTRVSPSDCLAAAEFFQTLAQVKSAAAAK